MKKSKEEMIGFELPSFEEYCDDRDLSTSSEVAKENYQDYLQDCIEDMENNEEEDSGDFLSDSWLDKADDWRNE
jgi:predicted neutral ceramidase superfamily lipid hydrolase